MVVAFIFSGCRGCAYHGVRWRPPTNAAPETTFRLEQRAITKISNSTSFDSRQAPGGLHVPYVIESFLLTRARQLMADITAKGSCGLRGIGYGGG
jgi:hypothetical protein